jgi:hypothetical protein
MAIYVPLVAVLLFPELLAGMLVLWVTGRARPTLTAATGAGFAAWCIYAAVMARGVAQSSGIGAVLLLPPLGAALGASIAGLLLALRAAMRRNGAPPAA